MHPVDHMRNLVWILLTMLFAGGLTSNFPASVALADPQSSVQSHGMSVGQSSRSRGLSSGTRSTGSVIVGANGSVYVYSNTFKLIGQIDNLGIVEGLALDAAGNLYISNGGGPGVAVYKNDYKTQISTLANPYPSDGVAVASNGTVAVLDAPPTRLGHLTIFAAGSTTPCASVALPNVLPLLQGAFDSAGNLYVTGADLNHNPIVGIISGGCSATGVDILSTVTKFSYAFGIQVTRFGKIAVEDSGNNVIYTYNPPHNGALGEPIATTELAAHSPQQFAFTANGAFLFAAEETANLVAKFAYPAGGAALQTAGQKQLFHPIGLVIAPPTQP